MNGLIEQYKAGVCAEALSVEYGVHLRKVYRLLHAAKVELRKPGNVLRLTDEVLQRAIDARGDAKAMHALADEVGLSQRYLRRQATEAFYERH